jgi:hypothetical protein
MKIYEFMIKSEAIIDYKNANRRFKMFVLLNFSLVVS